MILRKELTLFPPRPIISVVSVLLKMLTYSVYDFLRVRECLNIEVLRRRATHKFADSLALPQKCGELFCRSVGGPVNSGTKHLPNVIGDISWLHLYIFLTFYVMFYSKSLSSLETIDSVMQSISWLFRSEIDKTSLLFNRTTPFNSREIANIFEGRT